MTDRIGRSGQKLVGGVQKTVPIEVPAPLENCLVTPQIEKEHVHAIYDTIANHWSHTRYKAWPPVVSFIRSLPPHSLICDVGCGNAKNAIVATQMGHYVVASDISKPLIHVCNEREPNLNLMVADCLQTPFRAGTFDAAISIAVLHHLSSEARRIQAIREALRVVRVGGRFLLLTWARDQDHGGVSRHQFDAPDVFVAWHHKLPNVKQADWKEEDARALAHEAAEGIAAPDKNAIVYQRYCHVYEEAELVALFNKVETARIEAVFYDTGNWVVMGEKIE